MTKQLLNTENANKTRLAHMHTVYTVHIVLEVLIIFRFRIQNDLNHQNAFEFIVFRPCLNCCRRGFFFAHCLAFSSFFFQ